jgi:adenosylmethionine-8-amino-7-oxononanoate aminotransferase
VAGSAWAIDYLGQRARSFIFSTAPPPAIAEGLEAARDVIHDEPVLERVQALEQQLRRGLDPLRELPHVGDVRVIGGVGIIDLVRDKQSKAAVGYLDDARPLLAAEFLRRGLLLRPLGNVLYFMPLYVISEPETECAIDQITAVLLYGI